MADIKRYLDYAGLQEFWGLVKDYYAPTVAKAGSALQDFEVKYNDAVEQIVTIANNKVTVDMSAYAKKADLIAVLKFKGVVAKVSDLPNTDEVKVGWIYHVTEKSAEYVCIAEKTATEAVKWEEMGSILDLSNYYTKAEVDAKDAATLTAAKNYVDPFIDDLDAKIDAEETRAKAAETAEAEARATAITAEATARTTAIAAEATARDAAIATEATARAAADTQEVADRKEGDKEVYDSILSIQNFKIAKLFNNTEVTTAAELTAALADAATTGGVISVKNDLTLASVIEVPAGKKVAIDLEGHTIDAPHGVRAFNFRAGAEAVVTNGKLITEYDHEVDPSWAQYAPLMVIYGVASTSTDTTMTNVTFEDVWMVATHMASGTLVQTNGSQKNINITFNNIKMEGLNYLPARGSITINGGEFYMENGSIFSVRNGCPFTVNGGLFKVQLDSTYTGKWGHVESGTMEAGGCILVECCNYGEQGNPEIHYNGAKFEIDNASSAEFFPLLVIEYNGQVLSPASEMKADYYKATLVGDFLTDGETEPKDGWVYFSLTGVENKGKTVKVPVNG